MHVNQPRGSPTHHGRYALAPQLRWLCLIALFLLQSTVNAQPPEIPFHRPGEERLPSPEFAPEAPAQQFTLPPLEKPPPEPSLSYQPRVFVRAFRILGNTLLDPEELKAAVAPYVGREVSTSELQALRRKLTQLYIDRGYINSGVTLPDQQVRDGIITLKVIEGVLSRVDVAGNKRLEPDYIQDRIHLDPSVPLRLNALEEKLRLLLQDRLIERLNGQLTPGNRPGESVLLVTVEEARPYRLAFSVDNHRSPSVGAIRGQAHVAHWNLTGRGDSLAVRYGLTEGLNDWALTYSLPVTARGTRLDLGFERSDSSVVEEPFEVLDIDSEFESLAIRLRHPVLKTPNHSFHLGFDFEKRKSKTTLLGGIPFPSPGTEDGKSEVSVIRLTAEWLTRRTNQVLALRSTLSWGIDAFGATVSGVEPDGKFLSWLGQLQWARRMGENRNQLIFRTDVQLASDPLLSLEQFAVGGANTVRGYRENQLVRDNGWVSSLELRIPVFRGESGRSTTQLSLFADYGRAWNKERSTPDPESISSAGLGLRWDPTAKLHAELFGAVPFRNIDNKDQDLQDSGIHFLVSYRVF